MNYSIDLDIDLNVKPLQDQYQDLYGHCIENSIPNNEITSVGTAYLISAKQHNWQQEYFEDLLRLKIETVRIFVTNPRSILPVHKDCIANTNQLRPWAINVPLLNCDKGVNQWFEEPDASTETFTPDGSAIVPNNNNLILSEECLLNCTKIIRTDVYHNVNNNDNDKSRVIVSYRADPNITWNEIKKRIKYE